MCGLAGRLRWRASLSNASEKAIAETDVETRGAGHGTLDRSLRVNAHLENRMTGKSAAWGMRGMAVAPHSLAAESAIGVLREGGNALEAMVAAAARSPSCIRT